MSDSRNEENKINATSKEPIKPFLFENDPGFKESLLKDSENDPILARYIKDKYGSEIISKNESNSDIDNISSNTAVSTENLICIDENNTLLENSDSVCNDNIEFLSNCEVCELYVDDGKKAIPQFAPIESKTINNNIYNFNEPLTQSVLDQQILVPKLKIERISVPTMRKDLFFEYYICNNRSKESIGPLTIAACDIDKIVKITQAEYPFYIPISNKKIDVINDFRQRIRQTKLDEKVFVGFGWIPQKRKFLCREETINLTNGEKSILNPDFRLITCDKSTLHIYQSIKALVEKNPIVILEYCLAEALGPLRYFFEKAGFPLRFSFFVYGESGSLKTSLAKVFFEIYHDSFGNKFLIRRITEDSYANIDVVLASYNDFVVVFDDLCPQMEKQRNDNQIRNLERVVRIAGDGVTQSRTNIEHRDIKGSSVRSIPFVTGEFKGKGVSSNLRFNYVHIQRGDVNKSALSLLQNEPLISTILSRFINYLEINFDRIVPYIKTRFENERSKIHWNIRERTIDIYITLKITLEILCHFLIEERIPEAEVYSLLQKGDALLQENANFNNEIVLDKTYSVLFVECIKYYLSRGELEIYTVNGILTAEEIDTGRYSIYVDKYYYYFDPFIIFGYVKKYTELINQKLYETQKSFFNSLRTEGLLEAFPNGKYQTTSKRFKNAEKSYSLITIEKNKFENFDL